MRNRFRSFRKDRGAALPILAMMMVTLIGIAGFATDLGWYYLNASRIQRAADAGALAGVIQMPDDFPQAEIDAKATTRANTYEDGMDNATVSVAAVGTNPNQLDVTIRDTVDTFFTKIFGMNDVTIARTARAEYVPPLKLGSPSGIMGNDPTCFATNADCAGNYWIGIYGTYTNAKNGDPYSSFCNGGAPSTSCTPNPLYRTSGYLFGIIPSTSLLTIEGLDPNHRYDGGGLSSSYGDSHRTGDNKISGAPNDEPGPTTTFNLFAPDPTPEVVSDNGPPICTATYASIPQINPDDDPPFNPADWAWEEICSGISVSAGEMYVLQVIVVGADSSESGSNRFSLRVQGGNGQLFGIRDFSVFFNSDQANSFMYLAEVPDYYGGKTFVVEGFDPGDVGDEGTLELRYPTGVGTWSTFPSCRWYLKDTVDDPTWTYKGVRTPCSVVADNGEPLSSDENFQNKWFKMEADLPVSYSCSDCWWQMGYVFPAGANPRDHVTWKAYIVGNPIHLVPSP